MKTVTLPIVRVFGGVTLYDENGPISVGGHRQQRLLALLALRGDSVAGLDWLAEHLWEDHQRPNDTVPTLRTYVSRLRSAFPEGSREWIETTSLGYRYAGPAESLEHQRFSLLRDEATRARANGDPMAALGFLDDALSLWRGEPFSELDDVDWARGEIERLHQDRLEMLEERWEVSLALGRHTQITGELAAFTAEHGLRDRAVQQYALALHRSGRTTESLRVLSDHREALAELSGLDPSSGVVELEGRLLSADPSLSVEQFGRPLRGYRLLDQAGIGAFSVVWRAIQPSVQREVAIKQIRSELACQPDFIRRFEAEAQLVARLEHPHIVPLIDFWREPDSAYLVMRWLGGGTLERRLDDGPLTVDETVNLARQIGGALSTAHAHGIVHRDVKSANILFDEEGNAFLGDFGIAMEATKSTGPEAALSSGSPAYSSPEQLRRDLLEPASDVFSLGVVLFECLSGSLPFTTHTSAEELVHMQLNEPYPLLSELRTDVPTSIVHAVAKATTKEPAERFGSIADFIDALEPTLRTSAVVVDGPGPRSPFMPTDLENPYNGLRAFDGGDADRFFGRTSLINQLVDRLSGDTVSSRCVVVVGPSGSGKSSIVRAGLVPALRASALPGSDNWFTTTMTPGKDPFESLEAALLAIAVNPPLALVSQLRDGDRGILRGIRRCLSSDDTKVLVVIDQFEELFTGCSSEDARHFLDALAVAVEDPTTPLRLVATLRADYFHRPLEHRSFAKILDRASVNVTPLAPNELEEVIVEPARLAGVEFEPTLVARIAAETLPQPSPLPLLQYTLSELFDRRADGVLTIEAYDAIGGLSGALAERAEALHAGASDAQKRSIRRVFGRMTNPAGPAADVRRRVALAHLSDDPDSGWVIERFGSARLLMLDRDVSTREPTVEVAHEALLREWPRLSVWLEEDRDLLRSVDVVAAAAATWDEGGRGAADLYRVGRLENAMGLAHTAPDRLRPIDREFIDASQLEAEANRHLEVRRIQRLRRLVAGTGIALIVALIAGALAFRQSDRADAEAERAQESASRAQESASEAETQARFAETQTAVAIEAARDADLATLISRSASQATQDPELSLLLALESNRRAPGSATEQAILNALGSKSFANRVSGFGPLVESTSACRELVVARDGTAEFGVSSGQLVSRNPATGVVEKHGPSPAPCVSWMGSRTADRRVAVADDGMTMWLGTFDGAWDVEHTFDRPTFLVSRAFQTTHQLLFASGLDQRPQADLIDDRTGDTIEVTRLGDSFITAAANGDGTLVALSLEVRVLRRDNNGLVGPGLILILDGTTGEEMVRLDLPFVAGAMAIDDQAGELIVAHKNEGVLTTFDASTGALLASVDVTTTSSVLDGGLAVRDDGLILAVSASRIEVVHRRTGPAATHVDLRNVSRARVRSDSNVLTFTADDRTAIIDMERNPLVEQAWPIDGHGAVNFSGGRAAVVAESGDSFELVDLRDGTRSSSTPIDPQFRDSIRAFSALPVEEGEWLVADNLLLSRWEDSEIVEVIQLDTEPDAGWRHGGMLSVNLNSPQGYEVVQLVDLTPGSSGVTLTLPAPNAVASIPSTSRGVHVLDADGVLHTYDASGQSTGEIETEASGSGLIAVDDATGHVALPSKTGTVLLVDTADEEIVEIPTTGTIQNLGFARNGQILTIVAQDGSVRLWDLERGEAAGLVWSGSGAANDGLSWYDDETDSIWVATSGQLLRFSLDPERWIERACEIVGRDFTEEEWDRYVPGDEPLAQQCAGSA